MELSNGTQVRVGPLKWRAYKSLKGKVLDKLAELAGGMDDKFDAKFVSVLLRELPSAIDELNEDFIRGCLDKPAALDADDLDVSDFDNLYAEALQVNPIDKILEREKNSPAGELARRMLETMPDLLPRNNSDGGLPSKLNAYDPAGDQPS